MGLPVSMQRCKLISVTVPLTPVCMYSALADTELLRGGTNRRPIFYDVKGQALRPFLHISLQNTFTPRLLLFPSYASRKSNMPTQMT